MSSSSLLSARDKHSYGNNHQIEIPHFHVDWLVNFDEKCIRGSITHSCRFIESSTWSQDDDGGGGRRRYLQLDCRNLVIEKAVLVDNEKKEFNLEFEIVERPQEHADAFGNPLRIWLPEDLNKDDLFKVRVYYETTQQSAALQWLNEEQTAGKKHPYLFTQSQFIHARSLMPCFDSPTSKSAFSATIRIPKSRPLIPVMSALRRGRKDVTDQETGTECVAFEFEQPVPVASYLIALAVGKLECKKIGPRTHIWAEAEQIEDAAFEFEETEQFIAAAESFLTPYAWGIYDLLLLPPSFPLGGMENTCLTFVTPTLLAKDRSLANIVAHEITHSWSGNLVTNGGWEHFWLNEGFTMFIERRIIAKVNGEEQAELQAILGMNDLKASVEHFEKIGQTQYSALVPKLDNIDPDDAFSTVPYEKGFNFLYYLKELVGGNDVFEPFLKAYFEHFAGKVIVTEDMKSFFLNYFQDKVDAEKLASIEWDRWFYEPGMPIVENKFDTTLSKAAEELAELWANDPSSASQVDISGWSSNQTCLLLDILTDKWHDKINHNTLELLNTTYRLAESHNAEIKHRWHMLAMKLNYSKVYTDVAAFLTSQGRMKFVRPGYRALFEAADGGKELAIETFLKHRSFYHPICERMVAQDLQIGTTEDESSTSENE